MVINELQNGIYKIINNFIRIKNKKCKENILALLNYFIYINLSRGKMRFNYKIVSSDGFMLNLNDILLKLCEPIISKNMLNKINTNYFLFNKIWKDSTRSATNQQINQQITQQITEQKEEQIFGFTTEIFCLTLEGLHLGFSCIVTIVRIMV